MRTILLTHCFALSLLFSQALEAQPAPPSAEQVLKDACAIAKKDKKKVFIIFHASWCGWCHRMDSSMNDAACKKIFTDNFVIRHLTVQETEAHKKDENPGAAEMLAKYHGDSSGIPYWLIFDASGNLLADSRAPSLRDPARLTNVGCPAKPKEVDHFISALNKTAISDKSQLDIIRERFLKNAR